MFLIMNPGSRSGRGRKTWEARLRVLRSHGIDFECRETEYPGHALELARDSAGSGCESVVAVGGDGTINDVLNGILSPEVAPEARPSLGILYSGTSPDICEYHHIPTDPEASALALIENPPVLVDVGEIQYHTELGSPVTSYFLCSVNLGMGARVAAGSNSGLRLWLGDRAGTLISILGTLARFPRPDMRSTIDGRLEVFKTVLNITVGKNPLIASGLKVDTAVEADDGRMYLFSIQHFGFLGLCWHIRKMYRGTFQDHPNNHLSFPEGVEFSKCLEAPEVEFDGDPHGFLPCKIRVRKQAVRLIRPALRATGPVTWPND